MASEAHSLGAGRYLVDNAVYARADHPRVAPIWIEGLRRDQLVSCGPFVAEALYSARDAAELADLAEELTEGMPYVDLGEPVWRLARNAQLEMARVSHGITAVLPSITSSRPPPTATASESFTTTATTSSSNAIRA